MQQIGFRLPKNTNEEEEVFPAANQLLRRSRFSGGHSP